MRFELALAAFAVERRGVADAGALAGAHLRLRCARTPVAAAAPLADGLVVVFTLGARFLFEQRLPVGDWDLVIVWWISEKARKP